LTQFLGCPDRGDHTELPSLEKDEDEVEGALGQISLEGQHMLVGIHPGAKAATRSWSPERFGRVARRLHKEYGALITVTGTDRERTIVEAVTEACGPGAVNLAGRLSVGGLAALIRRQALLITNDTGPAHLAYATQTRSVTIFGSAEPERWRGVDTTRNTALSVSVPCRPCEYSECPIGYLCLNMVTVDAVARAARFLLDDWVRSRLPAIWPNTDLSTDAIAG
ncbi:MAG TPA: glycosyltransferase family 9 protein, partial [Chloroflexota bacterium]|nr:glycosyltransferase family 9 protein [Chloroflexota bacterium]